MAGNAQIELAEREGTDAFIRAALAENGQPVSAGGRSLQFIEPTTFVTNGKTPRSEFALSDMVRHYYSQLDALHKTWNYLALFGGAAVTASWAYGLTSPTLAVFLLVGFGAYAIGNAWAIYQDHSAFRRTSDAILEYCNAASTAVGPFARNLRETLGSTRPKWVLLWHVGVDVLIFAVLAARVVLALTRTQQ